MAKCPECGRKMVVLTDVTAFSVTNVDYCPKCKYTKRIPIA